MKNTRNKYPQVGLRLTDKDKHRLDTVKRKYQCETTIEAVRVALYIAAEKSPLMRLDRTSI